MANITSAQRVTVELNLTKRKRARNWIPINGIVSIDHHVNSTSIMMQSIGSPTPTFLRGQEETSLDITVDDRALISHKALFEDLQQVFAYEGAIGIRVNGTQMEGTFVEIDRNHDCTTKLRFIIGGDARPDLRGKPQLDAFSSEWADLLNDADLRKQFRKEVSGPEE